MLYHSCNGLFTLLDIDSSTNIDSNSEPDGYIVLSRRCSHCTDADSDLYLDLDPQLLLYPFWDGYLYPDWDPAM